MREPSPPQHKTFRPDYGSIPVVGGRPADARKEGKRAGATDVHARPFRGCADITLINMNLLYINNRGEIDFEAHTPLGVLYLAAVLEGAGYAVDLIDYQLFPIERQGKDLFDLDEVCAYFGEPADIIGLSCMVNLLPFTILVAERLKSLYPAKTIILGGVGPFGVEERILEEFAWIDIVARGEGETTILQLMQSLTSGKAPAEVRGISWRSPAGTVVRNPEQPRIEDLDSIPFPAYHLVNMAYYQAFNVVTTRGCPYGCRFCSVAPIWGHHASFRSHKNILAEIRLLHEKYGVRQILFQDEFFYSSEEKILDFCRKLAEAAMPVTWKCYGRANLVTEKAMARMAETGCVQLRFGIESGSARVLDRVVKGFHFKDALRAVTAAVRIFDSVETFFIWGFPFEDMEDFYQTVLQMTRFRQIGARILPSLLSMMPQTAIYKDYLAGRHDGTLTFVPEHIPVFVVTGHEVLGHGNTIPDKYRFYYDFIASHPDIFPGFFLYDYELNVLPKHRALRELGFI
ncbi:MAG TPA: radical SAM protein [Geobacteraceae bacterium]